MGETLKFVYTMAIFLSLFLVVTNIGNSTLSSFSNFLIYLITIFHHLIITFYYTCFTLQ